MTQYLVQKEFRLQDQSETWVEFTGVLLAHASSYEHGKSRWAEISVFRTTGGNFVVHGVGRTKIKGESDRPWCNVVTSAAGVIERLTRTTDGVRFMPHVPNRAVAEIAAQNDEEIHSAYFNHMVA